MPISLPRTKRGGAAGFTLIEMLVVLTIVGLLAAVAAARLPGAADIGRMQRASGALRDAAAAARRSSIETGSPSPIQPDGRKLDVALVQMLPDDGSAAIVFYSDGSSNGGTVRYAGRPLLRIDFLTGAARDAH